MSKSKQKPSGELLEGALCEIIRELGFNFFNGGTYHRAAAGKNQGGLDGKWIFKNNKNIYLWDFECKDWKSELALVTVNEDIQTKANIGKNQVQIRNVSDKIVDLLSKTIDNFPDVFCVLYPHKLLPTQDLEQINTLNNGRLPFKIVYWTFEKMYERLSILQFDSSKIYKFRNPDLENFQNKKQEILSNWKSELIKDSEEGKKIKEKYIEYLLSIRKKREKIIIDIKLKQEKSGYFYYFNIENSSYKISKQRMDYFIKAKQKIYKSSKSRYHLLPSSRYREGSEMNNEVATLESFSMTNYLALLIAIKDSENPKNNLRKHIGSAIRNSPGNTITINFESNRNKIVKDLYLSNIKISDIDRRLKRKNIIVQVNL